jgi:hypothetical protein
MKLDSHLADSFVQRFARLDDKRHSLPARRIHSTLNSRIRWSVGVTVLYGIIIRVSLVLSQETILNFKSSHTFQDLNLAVSNVISLQTGGWFHGHQGEDLQ